MNNQLPERMARHTVAKAIADAIFLQLKNERAELFMDLVGVHDLTGAKSFEVKLPGLGTVAKLTLSSPEGGATVVDRRAFTEWIEQRDPDWVEKIVRPATEKVILGNAKNVPGESEVCDAVTGEIIPGVKWHAKGNPTSFTVRYDPGKKEEIVETVRGQSLAEVVGPPTLPPGDMEIVEGEVL